jgi:hypothetical protein
VDGLVTTIESDFSKQVFHICPSRNPCRTRTCTSLVKSAVSAPPGMPALEDSDFMGLPDNRANLCLTTVHRSYYPSASR